jgi:Uma2 family endonuclease
MGTSSRQLLEEYLTTVYRPDRDYLEGRIEERNMGELDHADVQGALIEYLRSRRKQLGIYPIPELRVQVTSDRFRVPDIVVVLGGRPEEQVLTRPPFLCIEILSPEDTMLRIQARIDDYLRFGVRFVWIVDPHSRRGWIHTPSSIREASGGILRTESPELQVPLAELFDE